MARTPAKKTPSARKRRPDFIGPVSSSRQLDIGGTGAGKLTGTASVIRQVTLSANDPFEKLLIDMVNLQREKRADYAAETDIYQNFRRNAEAMHLEGYDALTDCLSMVQRKFQRVVNLRGRDPRNETVQDSHLDLAIFATLSYGLALEAAGE